MKEVRPPFFVERIFVGKEFEHFLINPQKGEVEHRGYYTQGGGWGMYKSEGDIECFQILVKPYRKSTPVWLKIGQKVIDYRLGWQEVSHDPT